VLRDEQRTSKLAFAVSGTVDNFAPSRFPNGVLKGMYVAGGPGCGSFSMNVQHVNVQHGGWLRHEGCFLAFDSAWAQASAGHSDAFQPSSGCRVFHLRTLVRQQPWLRLILDKKRNPACADPWIQLCTPTIPTLLLSVG